MAFSAFTGYLIIGVLFGVAVAIALFIRRLRSPKEFSYSLKTFDDLYLNGEDGELAHPRWKGNLPPVFLNGWHLIGWVDDFDEEKGFVKKVRFHSKDFVLFQARNGEFGLLGNGNTIQKDSISNFIFLSQIDIVRTWVLISGPWERFRVVEIGFNVGFIIGNLILMESVKAFLIQMSIQRFRLLPTRNRGR